MPSPKKDFREPENNSNAINTIMDRNDIKRKSFPFLFVSDVLKKYMQHIAAIAICIPMTFGLYPEAKPILPVPHNSGGVVKTRRMPRIKAPMIKHFNINVSLSRDPTFAIVTVKISNA